MGQASEQRRRVDQIAAFVPTLEADGFQAGRSS